MSKLRDKFASVGELVDAKVVEQSFQEQAEARGVTKQQLSDLATNLRNIDRVKNEVPTMPDFVRVRVGKLTVPKNFVRHIELLAKFADVSEESVWQLLMIETCQMYADRYSNLMEVLNTAVHGEA